MKHGPIIEQLDDAEKPAQDENLTEVSDLTEEEKKEIETLEKQMYFEDPRQEPQTETSLLQKQTEEMCLYHLLDPNCDLYFPHFFPFFLFLSSFFSYTLCY